VLKGESQNILLSEEISFCKQYLDIEAIRFSDRLKINFVVDPNTERYKVPNMILQPLIENAFKHGLMNHLDEDPVLEIGARLNEEKRLILVVKNTGQMNANIPTEGIGIHNVRKRLDLTYGNRARFDLHQDGNFVVAQIEISA
jgi:LytS/YehU family sensor histidine kinase